jgi:pimeloyl-ACP methyl ester carboxylesterase
VLVGSEDTVTPRAEAESMAAAMPQARLVVLEGVGHLSNLEAPGEFTRALDAFLDTLGSPA